MMCHIVTRKKSDPVVEAELKERVIHTRVPESLEAELRERAESLGISVSNLVRNVLGHAFGLVGDVVADSHAIARAARGDRAKAGAPPASAEDFDIVAWQSIVLAKNALCARCNAVLPKGQSAAIGITERGATGPIVCPPCTEGQAP
ncbi:MAG: hypothetical protein JWO36_1883 [Myxococcales bacterium]|nr:hypothetical protein [Myxococcales bacterium]